MAIMLKNIRFMWVDHKCNRVALALTQRAQTRVGSEMWLEDCLEYMPHVIHMYRLFKQ